MLGGSKRVVLQVHSSRGVVKTQKNHGCAKVHGEEEGKGGGERCEMIEQKEEMNLMRHLIG